MLILILIDAQYLQNVVFRFEKSLEGSKSLLLRFPPPDKKIPPAKFFPLGDLPYPLMLFGKTCEKSN